MTIGANGLTLTDNGISLAMSPDWSYEQQNWYELCQFQFCGMSFIWRLHYPQIYYFRPHFKEHGSVDFSGSGNLKVTLDVTMNKTSGGIHLNFSYCSIDISDFSIDFHGGKR